MWMCEDEIAFDVEADICGGWLHGVGRFMIFLIIENTVLENSEKVKAAWD